ncbi:uncharacterized protein LOC105913049 [Clupea harengus]|uniref:Uncharacterized protein LOC105913049 n=1 Tax=Clupea harengus TaxID=7950 RepID=A0A6P8GUT6_CLUHA|nr:uncharacterized protein LOC105913049 [Clupea harengus]
MVEWDNKAVNISEYLKFKGRIKLDIKTGAVTITNLTKDDSGLYDAEVIIRGKLINLKHRVEVTDPVTKAKVTCLSNATLHCEAEGDSLDYSWSGPGLQTAEMRGQTGPQISKENQDAVYTCVVNNPVGDSSVTYHASDCFTSGASSKTINAATNGIVTIQPLVEGEIEDILWKHKGNKMVEWDNTAVIVREYLTFKGRIKLDVKTGDVTIQNLTKDDSGLYYAEVIIRGKLIIRNHNVEVTDPVTTAKVTCLSNTTLHCEAEGDSLDYSWFGPGLQTAEMRGQTGPQISKENQDSVYSCVVNNPVSDSSVTYHASDCFTSGDHQLILGVVCAVVGVIALAGLGYYCYKINSRGQTHTGNEIKRETTGKIIPNQKMEESVLLFPGKPQASSFAETQNTCDQSLNSVEGEPTGDIHEGQKERIVEGGSLDGQSSNSVQDKPPAYDEEMNSNISDVFNEGKMAGYVQAMKQLYELIPVEDKVKHFEKMALMIPTTRYVPMNVPGPFKESDSTPKSDESADPDHHIGSSSGSPRQSGDADHTFSDDSKSPLLHLRNVESTCENERGTNTGTVKQNQSTINKHPSGSAGNTSTDARDTLSCERMKESVNVGDNSSGKTIITGSQATHTAATNTCDRSSDAEDRVTGDVQDEKMDTTVRLSNDDVNNIPMHEGQKERIGEGGSL